MEAFEKNYERNRHNIKLASYFSCSEKLENIMRLSKVICKPKLTLLSVVLMSIMQVQSYEDGEVASPKVLFPRPSFLKIPTPTRIP